VSLFYTGSPFLLNKKNMSKWMMTMTYRTQIKLITLTFITTLVTLLALNLFMSNTYLLDPLTNSCPSNQSHLVIITMDNVCRQGDITINSWLSWFAGDSQSAHLHFLDLLELLHHTLN
jgi:hypothetical protein